MKKTSRKFSSRKRRPVRKSYAKKAKRAPALKKMVKREIARQTETKSKQTFNLGLNLWASGAANWLDNIIPVGPNATTMAIAQGVANGSRIGNVIRTKRFVIKGTIAGNGYNATTNPTPFPQQVKMVVFYDRKNPTSVPDPRTDYFQDGGSNVGFSNDLIDLWRPVNTDRYRILEQRNFKVGYASYEGTGNQGGAQFLANNDFKFNCNFSVDLTKHYPKVVKFDENNSDPTTRGLYVMWYMAAASGGANSTAWKPVEVAYMLQYEYEDA